MGRSVFLTWRLFGSLPKNRYFPEAASSGQAFAVLDRLLEETRIGPFYLRQPAIADMIVDVLHYSANVQRRYTLHAFVITPNHIHLLVSPNIPLPQLTKALKGIRQREQTNC